MMARDHTWRQRTGSLQRERPKGVVGAVDAQAVEAPEGGLLHEVSALWARAAPHQLLCHGSRPAKPGAGIKKAGRS